MKEPSILTRKIFTKRCIDKTNEKILMLGSKTKININFFLNFRFISSLLVFFIVLYTNEFGILWAPIITIIYYILITYLLLENNIKIRINKLNEEALTFFEIFALCMESGSGFEIALKNTTDNLKSELSKEFKKTLTEIRYGKTINEALLDMGKRIPSPIIKDILINMVEANKLGTSILDTLNNQIDYLNNQKIMNIRKQLSKIPVKISIVSVLLFVPIILLIILAPIIIDILT
ncbi:MAG: type II secretion system F family protein [Bacilli bacterium]